jgi:purine-binding chemotaxis protein CheW
MTERSISRTYVVFRVDGLTCAFAREEVSRVLPLPALGHPPASPSLVEGILDLGGAAIPVLRLDRLFGFEPSPRSAYQHLILLQSAETPLALLVDRATGILSAADDRLAPVSEGETYNGCVSGQISTEAGSIQVLSVGRLLDERERRTLAEFQAMQQRRLAELEAAS